MKTAIKPINTHNKTHTQFRRIAKRVVLMTLHSHLSSLSTTVNVPFFTLLSGKWKRKIQHSYHKLAVSINISFWEGKK